MPSLTARLYHREKVAIDDKGGGVEEEVCYWIFCFVPMSESGGSIFGFAEYVAALALLVVVFTIVDIRYQFRVAIAPVPLYFLTFLLVGVIGLLALAPELWSAQKWWVPKTAGLSQPIWQSFNGALFLSLLLTWMHYAFLRPAVYGRRNAERYAHSLYRIVVKGSDAELSVVADELGRSAKSLVFHASHAHRAPRDQRQRDMKLPPVEGYAKDIFYLIADRKLCENMVRSAPRAAAQFFLELIDAGAYALPIGEFGKNVAAAAIANKDSILFVESDDSSATLIGHLKPFSAALFGNYRLVEGLGFASPLDISYQDYDEWDADQWHIYCAAILTFMKGMLAENNGNATSYVLNRAVYNVKNAVSDTCELDGSDGGYWDSDIYQRLRCAVDFVRDAVTLIDEQPILPRVTKRARNENNFHPNRDVYDLIANLVFEIVFAASRVSHTSDRCWGIHHNAVWSMFFDLHHESPAWKIVSSKFRRLMFEEFVDMKKLPNYKAASLLGITLSVEGLKDGRRSIGRSTHALGFLARRWAKTEFLALKANLPDVADACLIGTISLDGDGRRLVKTYAKGLNREAPREYLGLEGVVPESPQTSVRRLRASLIRRKT